ncbi:hypothetical protein BKA58DRAFT_401036 [Alternaria rosae]|uniref:uncharacterized protein n=1 Tax=Alternaria rosae TaxID=1187941 RepID=UPI001E8D90E9|nr:uncharacterized protein BKA58DRAFT_401036 [Alternaria rosae]KAH6872850.1 hypothetical protein BKA58DRAFT_401036 [Alternaria rosae]
MRNVLLATSAISGLVAALPQMINIEAALAVPTPSVLGPAATETAELPVSYNQAAATESAAAAVATGGVNLKKRDACQPQPAGAGAEYVPGQGSVREYLDTENTLRKAAQTAGTPTGYTKAFTDLTGSTEQIGYLTYKTLDTYSTDECAAFCNSEKFCLGFNLFFERDPSVDPGAECNDPAPVTNIKCSIYGYPVAEASATNQGQYRGDFHVVITGSNGYSKAGKGVCKGAPTVEDFNAPSNLPAAINAPLIKKDNKDYDTYNGMRLFNSNPYDPSLCAAACESQTQFDKEHIVDANGEYKPCNFFTSYILTKNGVPLGTYCALYTQEWDSSYAVNTGYYYGEDEYSVICAASYTASTPDSGKISSA